MAQGTGKKHHLQVPGICQAPKKNYAHPYMKV